MSKSTSKIVDRIIADLCQSCPKGFIKFDLSDFVTMEVLSSDTVEDTLQNLADSLIESLPAGYFMTELGSTDDADESVYPMLFGKLPTKHTVFDSSEVFTSVHLPEKAKPAKLVKADKPTKPAKTRK